MMTAMLAVLLALLIVALVLLVLVLTRLSTAKSQGAEILGLGTHVANLEGGVLRVEAALRDGFTADREARATESRATRDELRAISQTQTEAILAQLKRAAEAENRQLDMFAKQLQALTEANERRLGEIRTTVEAKLKETIETDRQGRTESAGVLKGFQESLVKQLGDMATSQRTQLDGFSQQLSDLMGANDKRMEALRQAVEDRLKAIQGDTSAKLEQMRATVDEKLQTTLERRLGESFKLVSERLERVQRGLGEMQALASDVGGLKKVLANVKSRGGWGEVQLGSLLEDILIPEQYARNVATKKGSRAFVEYAIKLPGRDDADSTVWLPVDAKFPSDVYERLVDAQENADPELVEQSGKELESSIRSSAKDIAEKYLDPPHTTDFALLFVPTEGLYAEILRRPGFALQLQRDYRVVLTGPMTLAALLNSLQMGFRTLAIQKQSSEVWRILGAVKAEFGTFGGILARVHKQLQTASNTIESAETRTRVISRKLKSVEELPARDAQAILPQDDAAEEENHAVSLDDGQDRIEDIPF